MLNKDQNDAKISLKREHEITFNALLSVVQTLLKFLPPNTNITELFSQQDLTCEESLQKVIDAPGGTEMKNNKKSGGGLPSKIINNHPLFVKLMAGFLIISFLLFVSCVLYTLYLLTKMIMTDTFQPELGIFATIIFATGWLFKHILKVAMDNGVFYLAKADENLKESQRSDTTEKVSQKQQRGAPVFYFKLFIPNNATADDQGQTQEKHIAFQPNIPDLFSRN